MADRTEVVINTEPEAQQLKKAFDLDQAQQRGKPSPAGAAGSSVGARWLQSMRSSVISTLKNAIRAPLADLGPPGRVVGAALTTPPTQWPGQIKSFVSGMVWGIILDPFSALGAPGRLAAAGLMTFGKPLITGAIKMPLTLGKIGMQAFGIAGAVGGVAAGVGIAAAVLALVVKPLINLGLTYKILRLSYNWAQETVDKQMRVYARTRRTFPGIIGEEFEQARQTTWAKLQVVSGLFGESADAMWFGFQRKMQAAQRGGHAGGARDMFADLGLTPQAVQQWEEMRGGEKMNLNDMLFLFIRRREVLDAQIQASGEGTKERSILLQRKAKLLDSAVRLFGIDFSDMIGAFSRDDLKRLNQLMLQSAPLAAPADAENAQQNINDYRIALETVKNTFRQLKEGIVGTVQPIFTKMMDQVRDWLMSTGSDGETLAMKLRNLGASLAIHAWETLQELVAGIGTDDLKGLMNVFKTWNPKQDLDRLLKLGHLLKLIFKPIWTFFKWVMWVVEKLKPLDRLLGSPIGRGGKLLGKAAKGLWGVGETAGVWWKAYRVAGGGAMGRAAAARAVGMYRAGIRPGGATAGAIGPGGMGGPTGGTALPGDVLGNAKKIALEQGPAGVMKFLNDQGYPRNGAWCGSFAASVIKSMGLTPPKNPQVASNWRNFGEVVNAPQPGDIAVKKGSRFGGGYTPTGATGSHVTFVESVDLQRGTITTVGGNQGRQMGGGLKYGRATMRLSDYEFRRVPAQAGMPNAIQPGGGTEGGAGATGTWGGGGTIGKGGNLYAQWAPKIKAELQAEFGFTREQAAGLVGNLGAESEGFSAMQEWGKGGPGQQRGGLGIGQWTAERRRNFERWAAARGLSTSSYEANIGFLKHELRTSHAYFVPMLKGTRTVEEATDITHRKFEIPGDVLGPNPTFKSRGKRQKYAALAYGMPSTAAPTQAAPQPAKPTTVAMMTTAPPPTSLQRGATAQQEAATRQRERDKLTAKKVAQENARKRLTDKPSPKDATDEAKKVAKAVTDGLKKGIEDKEVRVPVKLPGDKDRDTETKARDAERLAA